MTSFIFDAMFLVLKVGFNIFCDLFVAAVAWLVLFCALAIVVFPLYFPTSYLLSFATPKLERLYKLKQTITKKGEEIAFALFVISGVLSIPILLMGDTKTLELLDEKIKQTKPHEVIIGTDVRQYKLLALTSPKHVYATFEDTSANLTYSHIYVSTYCKGSANRLGDLYNIKVTRYQMSDDSSKTYLKFNDLPGVFCE